jgi:hypothetical protein
VVGAEGGRSTVLAGVVASAGVAVRDVRIGGFVAGADRDGEAGGAGVRVAAAQGSAGPERGAAGVDDARPGRAPEPVASVCVAACFAAACAVGSTGAVARADGASAGSGREPRVAAVHGSSPSRTW